MTRNRVRWTSAALVSVVSFLSACTPPAPDRGPLTIGSGHDGTQTAVCVSDLGEGGSFFVGERADNPTDLPVRITSVEANGVEGLEVVSTQGRLMESGDPHFLAVSAEEASDTVFARALEGLEPIGGLEIPPGASLGIVIQLSLDADAPGRVSNLTIAYETGEEMYSSMTSVGLEGASGACPP